MTREEAIKHLIDLLPHYEPEIYAKDTLHKRQAIQFAINHLNAEKVERCQHISGGLGACPKCMTPYSEINGTGKPSAMGEIVICSAIKLFTGEVYRGHRHGDCILGLNRQYKDKVDWSGAIQGFITSKNRFVSREEGRKLQDAAGIKSVDKEGYRGDTLFSEDLY